jgi:hypothetical protein
MHVLPLLLALVALLSGCNSTAEMDSEYSQGQIVPNAVDEVWVATHSAMRGLGSGRKLFDSEALEAQAVIQGEQVTVRIEGAGYRRTIVRVLTRDAQVAADVLRAITALLPRS